MAEQTFRSPGFFEREIDASQRKTEIVGVPAGIVGTANKGPAFIPVTVGSMTDFVNKFGDTGARGLANALQHNTSLTELMLEGNEISEELKGNIIELLEIKLEMKRLYSIINDV